MSYEVLYNSCYGGFSFPKEFIREAFCRFPPESTEGQKLWRPTCDSFIQADDPIPTGKWIHRIVKTDDFVHGYKWIYYEKINQRYIDKPSEYCTKDFKTYYFVSQSYDDAWRTIPSIIAMAREYNLINNKHNHTELRIAKVPADYDFGISEYDGMEKVCVTCPTEVILTDLVRIIKDGNREGIHILTQRLLEGRPVREILYPKVEYDSDEE